MGFKWLKNLKNKQLPYLAILLIVAMVFEQILASPLVLQAQFAPLQFNEEKLVLVIADESLLETNRVERVVRRYAQDIQRELNKTTVSVLEVSSNESPAELAALLKQIYFGNISEYENTDLEGIVVVGDVPLPVVDREGYRYISLYPLTDFENPLYFFDEETGYFKAGIARDFEPEIWHGVIQFDSDDEYISYFDKNHAYYEGDEDLTNFDEKIFYAEPAHDAKALNSSLVANYQNFLTYMEDLAYNRVSKELASVLTGGIQEEVESLEESLGAASRGTLTASLDIEGDASDVYMKSQIEKSFSKLTALFAKAVAEQQAAILGTGRYSSDDYVTPIKAAALKDEYMISYFVLLNNMLEQKIDEIVQDVQSPIKIPKGARLQGEAKIFNPPSVSGAGSLTVASEPIFSSSEIESQYFVNGGIDENFANRIGLFGRNDDLADAFLGAADSPATFISGLEQIVGGQNIERITDAEQCRLHIGGRIQTDLSKTVEVKRGAIGGTCTGVWEGRDDATTWAERNDEECSIFYGEDLRDEYRPELVNGIDQSALTHEACFNFRPFDQYVDLLETKDVDASNLIPNASDQAVTIAGTRVGLDRIFASTESFKGSPDEWNSWGAYFLGNSQRNSFTSIRPISTADEFSVVINDRVIPLADIRDSGINNWAELVDSYLEDGEALTQLRLSRSLTSSDLIDTVDLQVVPIGQQSEISSVIFHKNPESGFLEKALENPTSADLPIDDVRHVTFSDNEGNLREIIYPNIFDATSASDFRSKIVEIERALSELSTEDYSNELTRLISAEADSFSDGRESLNRASAGTVDELIEWRGLNINQKYARIFNSLLNEDIGTNVDLPSSFEIAVISSESDDAGFEYEILKEEAFKISGREVSSVTREFEQEHEDQEVERERRSNSRPTFSDSARVPFPQWFGYLKNEWLPSVTNIAGERTPANSTGLKSYEEVIGDYDSEISAISIDVGAKNQTVIGDNTRSVELRILNEVGNKVVGKAEFVTLQIQGAEFAEGTDQDPDREGVQVFMVTGEREIQIVPTQKGEARISAQIGEVVNSETINFHDELTLSFTASRSQTTVNGEEISLRVKLLNEDGQSLIMNTPRLGADNPEVLSVEQVTEEVEANEYLFNLSPSTKSGRVNVSASLNGVTPTTREFIVAPGVPESLFFNEAELKVDVQDQSIQELKFIVIDEFGNKVNNNFDNINVSVDDPAKLNIIGSNISAERGEGVVRFKTTGANTFGNVYIRINKSGLESAYYKLVLGNKLSFEDYKGFNNTALYYDLKTTTEGFSDVARSLILNGKTQTVSTLTASLNDAAPMLYIHRTGAIEVVDDSSLNIVTNIGSSEITTDIFDSQSRKFAIVKVDPTSLGYIENPEGEIENQAGIFMVPTSATSTVDGRNLNRGSETVLHIGPNGIPVIDQEGILIRQKDNQGFYTLEVIDQSGPIGEIIYNFESAGQVRIVPVENPEVEYKEGLTLPSSSLPKGIIFYNPNRVLTRSQLPNSSDLRDDDFIDNELIGLREDDKSVLLFAAGQSVGEANKPYLSEIGVVVGDPVISLPSTTNRSLATGFGYDIGEYIGRTETDINSVLNTEDSIIFGDKSGNISLFDKKTKTFQKNILNIPAGIKELHEVNLEGRRKEVLVLTEEECIRNDSCIYILRDNELERVEINNSSKAAKVLPADFNGDGDDDLAIVNIDKSIKLHINRNGEIQREGNSVANTASTIDPRQNLIGQVWITDPQGGFTLRRQTSGSSRSSSSSAGGRVVSTTETAPTYETYKLRTVAGSDYDNPSTASIETSPFISSTLYRRDKNGGQLRDGDILEYRLTLNADSGSHVDKFISIPLTSNLRFIEESLTDGFEFFRVDSQQREILISGVTLSGGQTREIIFDVEYRANSDEKEALVEIVTDEEGYPADSLPDFKMQVPGADYTVYYYSSFDSSTNQLRYIRLEKQLATTDVTDHTPAIPDLSDIESLEDYAQDLETQVASTDSDGDGIADAIDTMNTGLNDIATGVEDSINRFMCDGGGCIATPINRALLVPSNGVPGTPVFGWGCPNIPPVQFGTGAYTCLGGRFYLSPTLTGELAGALCIGQYPGASCWATSLADLGAACDVINAGIQDLMSSAVSAVTSPLGNSVITTGSSPEGDDPIQTSSNVQVPGFPSVITDWVSAQYDEIISKIFRLPTLTIIYPSPSSIAAGFKVNEDADELENNELRFDKISDVLADIHAMPLFNVELETQVVKYPTVNPEEFSKYSTQLVEIYEQNKLIVQRTLNTWQCYGSEFITEAEFDRQLRDGDLELAASASNECISLELNSLKLFAAFDANIDALKAYRDLPRNIFEAENFLADYAGQLLGYVDQILDSTAGYISRNTTRLEEWQQTFIDIQNLITSISAILDVSLNYMEACDDCRSSRTNGGFQLLLNFFLQIPTPPVIPFPQVLPDITIDISQIEAQVNIVLPRFEFVPDTIVLPDLKNFIISLPEAPPVDFSINPGKYGLGLFATLPAPPDIGALIVDLPDLPDLELPTLPEIPKAPTIDGPVLDFFVEIEVLLDTLSTILRIYCLIQKGLIPTPETQLAAQIQEMTSRPLTPVLPIDIGLGFQAPSVEIDYIQELRLILETNLDFEFGAINNAAESITENFNEFQTNLNEGVEQKLQESLDAAQPLPEEFTVPGTDEIDALDLDFEALRIDLEQRVSSLTEASKKIDESTPDDLTLVAGTKKAYKLEVLADLNLDRGFDIPQGLQSEIDKIIAFRNGNLDEIKNLNTEIRAIASTEEVQNSTQNISSTTFQVAQAGTVGFSNSAQFNPEGGIYIYNSERETSEKVVRYNAESTTNIKVNLIDADLDGDEDLIYARGNEIFLKSNLNSEPSRTRNTSRIRTTSFENLREEIPSLKTLTDNQIKTSSRHKTTTISLPETLSDQSIVIDVYEASLRDGSKDSRFVIDSNAENSNLTEANNAELTTGERVTKDGFGKFYFKGGFTPNITLPLENKTYQIAIMIVNQDTGKYDVISRRIATTPNICSDESPPQISIDPGQTIRTPILQPIDISLGESTDSETEIKRFFLDTNLAVDSDGDGDRTNDDNLSSPEDRLISRFRLAGSATERSYSIAAWAEDIAGNRASQRINIEVVTPEIILESVNEDSISGRIDPPSSSTEVTIVRERDGLLTELGDATTDENGEFVYEDLETDGNIMISDASGNELFEINDETGTVIPRHSSANIEVQPAIVGQSPTTIILKKNDEKITQIVRVPDSNNDVQVVDEKPSTETLNSTTQVFVTDSNARDSIQVKSIAGSSAGYAGGAEVLEDGTRKFIIDVDGSIIKIDSTYDLTLERVSNINSAQWFELKRGSSVVAEVFVGTSTFEIQYRDPNLIPQEVTETEPQDSTEPADATPQPTTSTTFADVPDSDQDSDVINYLEETGVVDGVVRDGVTYFEPDREITRAEYSKIILNTLCILPRPEAFLPPETFSDIPYDAANPVWYYEYTKETQLQNFFTGYLGEIDPATGLPPFKPLNPITRAEAAKVILEALNTQNILDLSDVPVLEPWYLPYLQISTNLAPYLIDADEIRQSFLLTEDEAEVPLRNITRREFAIMAYRALNVQNCLETDDDNDGIPYYFENQNGLDPDQNDGDIDSDGDGVSNRDEYEAGTNPNAPDTERERIETNAGIYMERIVCNTCPCQFTVEHEADIKPGDEIFVILRSSSSGTIYQRSESITFRP